MENLLKYHMPGIVETGVILKLWFLLMRNKRWIEK